MTEEEGTLKFFLVFLLNWKLSYSASGKESPLHCALPYTLPASAGALQCQLGGGLWEPQCLKTQEFCRRAEAGSSAQPCCWFNTGFSGLRNRAVPSCKAKDWISSMTVKSSRIMGSVWEHLCWSLWACLLWTVCLKTADYSELNDDTFYTELWKSATSVSSKISL